MSVAFFDRSFGVIYIMRQVYSERGNLLCVFIERLGLCTSGWCLFECFDKSRSYLLMSRPTPGGFIDNC